MYGSYKVVALRVASWGQFPEPLELRLGRLGKKKKNDREVFKVLMRVGSSACSVSSEDRKFPRDFLRVFGFEPRSCNLSPMEREFHTQRVFRTSLQAKRVVQHKRAPYPRFGIRVLQKS